MIATKKQTHLLLEGNNEEILPTETVTKCKPLCQTGTTIFETSPSQGRHSQNICDSMYRQWQ